MREYLCNPIVFDDPLTMIRDTHAFEIRFTFELTPIEFVGRPDEKRHIESRDVRLTINGTAFGGEGIPKDEQNKMTVIYWYALETLKQSEDFLHIDRSYALNHPVDPVRIEFPPKAAFPVAIRQKMGFR